VRISLAQPVLKKDLYTCEGEISDDAKDEILVVLGKKFGLLPDEVEEYEEDSE